MSNFAIAHEFANLVLEVIFHLFRYLKLYFGFPKSHLDIKYLLFKSKGF